MKTQQEMAGGSGEDAKLIAELQQWAGKTNVDGLPKTSAMFAKAAARLAALSPAPEAGSGEDAAKVKNLLATRLWKIGDLNGHQTIHATLCHFTSALQAAEARAKRLEAALMELQQRGKTRCNGYSRCCDEFYHAADVEQALAALTPAAKPEPDNG